MTVRRACRVLIPATLIALAVIQCSKSTAPITPETGPGAVWDYAPAWSPDGQWVAFMREGPTYPWDTISGLYLIRRDGSQLTRLLHHSESGGVYTIDWSTSGWLLIAPGPHGIYKIRPDGSSMTVFDSVWALYASWSPDGSECALLIQGKLWLMDSSGANLRQLNSADTAIWAWDADWGPRNKILDIRYVEGVQQRVFAETDPISGTYSIVYPGYPTLNAEGSRYLSDWMMGFVKSSGNQHPQLIVMDLRTQAQRCITCGDDYRDGCGYFDVNPSTGEFVYTRTKYGGLWIIAADGSNPIQLTDPPWPTVDWSGY